MYAIHRILVAIKEPRARAIPAIAKAAQLARALGAEVCLFHAIPEPIYLDIAQLDSPSLAQLEQRESRAYQRRLEALAQGLRRRGLEVTTAVTWDYPAHEAVIRAAEHFEADLIVVDSHRSGHLVPWLLHFTDWELLRMSRVPVLLVKNRKPYRRPRVLAAVDPGHAFAKPRDLDDEILRFADTFAQRLRGTLHAAYAFNPLPPQLQPSRAASRAEPGRVQREAAARAHAELAPKLNLLRIPRARRHVIAGFAVDVIQHVADDTRADIVVMGAVARSGLKRLLIGNTAERILDRLNCDVLIVKPREFGSPVARRPRGAQIIAATPLLGY